MGRRKRRREDEGAGGLGELKRQVLDDLKLGRPGGERYRPVKGPMVQKMLRIAERIVQRRRGAGDR